MKYFKNTELAKLYHISEKSVRNWIEAAEASKLDLRLHSEDGKNYIANTARNTTTVESLVEKGKKYKNTRGLKVVRPTKDFYKLYSPKQIIDIISNLDIYHESPLQYTYFNGGATRWNDYVLHLLDEDISNPLSDTVELLNANLDYFDQLLESYTGVNIIDLGVGNALPVKDFLRHFRDNGMLKRYIGIDISKEMLDIAKKNVTSWFDDTVHFEGYVRDIVYERFDDLLVSESFGSGKTLNIMLFLGGTLSNFREPEHALATIHDSMGKHDLVVFAKKLDNQKSRRFFELANGPARELVLELLNIDKSYYSLEAKFDEGKNAREALARLNVALSVEFELNGQKRLVEFNKGDAILIWRARHQNTIEIIQQFDANGFELLQAGRSIDQTYLMTISEIKTGSVS